MVRDPYGSQTERTPASALSGLRVIRPNLPERDFRLNGTVRLARCTYPGKCLAPELSLSLRETGLLRHGVKQFNPSDQLKERISVFQFQG
jgi:hypothetical protein